MEFWNRKKNLPGQSTCGWCQFLLFDRWEGLVVSFRADNNSKVGSLLRWKENDDLYLKISLTCVLISQKGNFLSKGIG